MISELQGVEWRRSGRTQKACCPKHIDNTPSLILYEDGHFHCYSCGWHGWADKELKPSEPRERKPKHFKTIDWTPYREAMVRQKQLELAVYRSYDPWFVHRLVNENLVGLYEDQFCIPIYQDDRIVRLHVRGDPKWFYYPLHGASATPLIMGSKVPDETHIFESQWDMFAVAQELIPLYKKNLIATRGAGNANKLGFIHIPSTVYIWPQNDEAGEKWTENVQLYLPNRKVYIVRTSNHKDPNDFLRAGGKLKALYESSKNADPQRH